MYRRIASIIVRTKSNKLDYMFYLILITSLIIRVINLDYNSAFNDEGIYIVIGKMGLFAGDWWSYGANLWMAGLPYIYPPLTAIAYQIGGLIGSRLLNVFFGILLIEEVYRFTRQLELFDEKHNQIAGLIAAFFAGFSGIGLYVSELATYDILSFFLMMFAINSFIKAAKFDNGKYYFLCAMGLLFAFLTKIITAVFYPLLFILALIILKRQSKKHQTLATYYLVIPLFIGLSIYAILNMGNLISYVTTHRDLGKAENISVILSTIFSTSGFLAIISVLVSPVLLFYKKGQQLLILVSLALVIPLFHIVLNREQTLNKHLYLSVLFLSVIAAYGLSSIILIKNKVVNLISIFALGILGLTYISSSQIQVHEYQSEWVNTNKLQLFLKNNVRQNSKILTENGGAVILALYDITFPPKNVVTFDWIDYSNISGDQGYIQAVNDQYFDYIELDNQFAGRDDLRAKIITEMNENYMPIYNQDNFKIYERNNI